METQGKIICTLCLQICEDFKAIEGEMKDFLDIQLKMELAAIQYPVMCTNCAVTLKRCFDFKVKCINTRKYVIAPFIDKDTVKLDLIDVFLNKNKNCVGVPEVQDVCGLCMTPIKNHCAVSIDNEKGDVALKDMIKRCLPELDFTRIEKPVICSPCHDSLEKCFHFVSNCFIVNDRVKREIDIEDDNKEFAQNSMLAFEEDTIKREDTFCFDKEIKEEIPIIPTNVKTENPYERETGIEGDDKELVQNSMKGDFIKIEETFCSAMEPKEEIIEMEDQKFLPNEGIEIKTDESDFNRVYNSPRDNVSPPTKRPRKGHLDVRAKHMILNVYKHEMREHPTMVLDELQKRVAEKTGVCSRTVYNVYKEYKETHTFSAPARKLSYKKYIDAVDDFDKSAVRRKVHQFFFRNELPTIDKVLQEVNDDPDLPDFKRSTFYNLLKQLNFKFKNRGRKSILLDRDEIILWRREYLEKIRAYRNENRKIYYLDETWVDASVSDGSAAKLKNPSGKRKRLIACHIGSKDGFIPGALWLFESIKTGKYHEEVDAAGFEEWFSKILPALEENCVVVMDDASYHRRKSEQIPTAAFKKSAIQDWLHSKNIKFNDDMLKVQLLSIVKEHKKAYNKHVLDEMAKKQNKEILRLPPYHCELNPIELIWADIKNYIADKNGTKFAELKKLFTEAVGIITPEKWKKYDQHVRQEVEQQMWVLDDIMEIHVELLLTNVNDNDTSSSSSSSE